jgi:hypothetical protein
MKTVHELKKMLDKELDTIVAKGSITPTELENAKHIVEIFAMVKALDSDDRMYDEGHSGHNKYQYRYPDQRYVDWGYGRSYMSPEEDYGRSYGRHGMGYSGHEPMEYIIMELKRLHAKTSDDRGREVLADCIEELESK